MSERKRERKKVGGVKGNWIGKEQKEGFNLIRGWGGASMNNSAETIRMFSPMKLGELFKNLPRRELG